MYLKLKAVILNSNNILTIISWVRAEWDGYILLSAKKLSATFAQDIIDVIVVTLNQLVHGLKI